MYPLYWAVCRAKVFLHFLPERVSVEPKKMQKKKTKDVEGRTDEFSIIKTGMLLFLTAKQSCQKMLTLWGQTIFFPCEWTSEMPTIFQRKNSVIAPKIHSKLNCSDAVMAFYFLQVKEYMSCGLHSDLWAFPTDFLFERRSKSSTLLFQLSYLSVLACPCFIKRC